MCTEYALLSIYIALYRHSRDVLTVYFYIKILKNHAVKKMARYRYTVDEAVNVIAGDDDLGDINASDLEDIESDDGDVEEADYISSSGEAHLVSHRVLQSRIACEEDDDEPALRDSLLLLDEDLCESDDETTRTRNRR
jgi:hypothetical protein